MSRRKQLFWKRARKASQDATTRMFAHLRTRLTLLYCAMLGGTLLLFGTLFYVGVYQLLFSPVQQEVFNTAQLLKARWQSTRLNPCTTGDVRIPISTSTQSFPPNLSLIQGKIFISGCFDRNASSLVNEQDSSLPASLPAISLDTMLAKKALAQGSAADIVDGGSNYGRLYRYAEVVRDAEGTILGVVQSAQPIGTQEAILQLLLLLLLTLGITTLLGVFLGGQFLAGRALEPARIASVRQQAFVADASHELRTPLTLLRADAELLLRASKPRAPEEAELLADIVAEAEYMTSLASNMLTLARLDSGNLQIDHAVVDLDQLLQTLARRFQAIAAQKGIALHITESDSLAVIADRTLLEQAVLTVLDNALKYNREGGEIKLRVYREGRYACLEVSDTGQGIPQEHLPLLTERFYRVDKARTNDSWENEGAGLGLAIAQGIMQAHNGVLRLHSVYGVGTTAILLLPAGVVRT